ncbi:MAG: acyl-CoA dehydrogenase family protein [Bradymonadaceae bacterium]|nr:acyl-CoA dehydrogenase family protein [Lujinxingiaceae bacterium]
MSQTELGREKNIERLLGQKELLPLLPMIYVAWADGELAELEVTSVLAEARRHDWIDANLAQVLGDWLNPDSPPTATELQTILAAIEQASPSLTAHERASLSNLGLALARNSSLAQDTTLDPKGVTEALTRLEAALGLVGAEAARDLLSEITPRKAGTAHEQPAAFDVAALTRVLDGKYVGVRDEIRELLAGPKFEYAYGLELSAHRAHVLGWVQALADAGFGKRCFPSIGSNGQDRDMGEFLAIFEMLGFFDLNLPIKFGVQFGLFGGSIYFLGSERHHTDYLGRVATLELQGCYAMTEMGRGSNVRDLETLARYDAETGEFVIHTPSESARKEWIGGAGRYATMATVFAQLEVAGEHYGVHAFLVPIRDEAGKPMAGVRIEDQGLKMGLNGIDNGRLWFDQVRIPRANLLNRFGDVDESGAYQSSIPSSNKRFFTMLSTLVAGRLGIAAAGLSASKAGLAIAIRYGAMRRQFGPAGEPEIPILDYRMHQRQLMPRLATSYALSFALEALSARYNDASLDNRREVEAHAAGLKAFGSWHAVDTIQACRECCGGQGYLALNRLPGLRTDVDVFVTFEGANMVMMQQVAKARLTEYRHELSDANFFTLARYLARQAASKLSETNLVITRNTDESHLRDAGFQQNAFRYRENDLLIGVARRIKRRIDEGKDSFEAFNECQDHVVALAQAHIERVILEDFVAAVERCTDEAIKTQLKNMCDLYAMWHMEKDLGWFLENNYIQSAKAAAIRDLVNKLCSEVRSQAVPLVNAFGIPDNCLSAPIAFGEGKEPAESRVEFAHGLAT